MAAMTAAAAANRKPMPIVRMPRAPTIPKSAAAPISRPRAARILHQQRCESQNSWNRHQKSPRRYLCDGIVALSHNHSDIDHEHPQSQAKR